MNLFSWHKIIFFCFAGKKIFQNKNKNKKKNIKKLKATK